MVAATLSLTGCSGALSWRDFQQVVRDRGGGVTVELFRGPIETVEDRLATDGLVVRTITADPVDAYVALSVRDPARPENLDLYVFRGNELSGEPTPVSVSERTDLDEATFELDRVAVDRIEGMVDRAIARFGAEGAWVQRITVGRRGAGDPQVIVRLAAPRADATATFTAAGELLALERR